MFFMWFSQKKKWINHSVDLVDFFTGDQLDNSQSNDINFGQICPFASEVFSVKIFMGITQKGNLICNLRVQMQIQNRRVLFLYVSPLVDQCSMGVWFEFRTKHVVCQQQCGIYQISVIDFALIRQSVGRAMNQTIRTEILEIKRNLSYRNYAATYNCTCCTKGPVTHIRMH